MAKRILGLDLGTNSIGWAVVDDDGCGEFELIRRGVHIFQEGVKIEKGIESSKAAERTKYRAARRLKFRRKLRKIKTLNVLSTANFCPTLSDEELKNWRSERIYPLNPDFRDWCRTSDPKTSDKNTVYKNPYYFRWLAATESLDLNHKEDRYKLGRAFYHIAQRRGFKSNRLDTTKESDGVVSNDITALNKKMNNRTLGQYFFEECYKSGEKIRKIHTSRDEHYLAEFNFICEKQGVAKELKNELHKAIFYQRPLKSQKGLVATCPFEPKKKRAPISHPLFEEFRMWQTLNNIKIKTMNDVELRPLTTEEKDLIIPLFLRVKPQFDFKDIAKKLTPKGQKSAYVKSRDTDAHVLFNYRDNQTISGCPLSAKLKNLFVEDYKAAIAKTYRGNKETKDGKQRSADDLLYEVWHALFSFNDKERLGTYAKKRLGLTDEQVIEFLNINPKQGYGALSLKAIRKILPYLKQGLIYSHAVFFANLDEVIGISANEDERLKTDISTLIDEHKQYVSGAKCVNEFVREYKKNPRNFNEKYDLRDVQAFETTLPKKVRDLAESICKKIKRQISLNNGNGEYFKIERLEKRVGDYLIENFDTDSVLLKKLYHPSAIETYKPAKKHSDGTSYLGDPRISSIKNPVFMRAMFRVKAVVNELLKQGEITDQMQIHVEMAKELNDANKRAAIRTWQKNNEIKRNKYKEAIEEAIKGNQKGTRIDREATGDEILKYQLWEEQNHICPYTGVTIELTDFIGKDPKYDIEHTIPRSLACDNSQENMTLCDGKYNREIKKAKIPFECPNYKEILPRVQHWQEEVDRLHGLIGKKRKDSRPATTKEKKDKAIQERLILEMERNYLREKHRRFTMEEITGGFKNSQLVDTRIITKYARLYLKTVFSTVHTVNGKATGDFRQCWGVEKTRDNHAHHAVDAIIVACVTRNQYDELAQYYHEYESYKRNDPSVPEKPHFEKPWKTFTEDMKNLKNEILVSHYAPNHLLKQTKKKAKLNGKIIIQKGQTARGSLHKDTFYGAIKRPIMNKFGKREDTIKFVVRKPLDNLETSDVKKIVDDKIREIVTERRDVEASLKKTLKTLEKQKVRANDDEAVIIQRNIDALKSKISNLYALPNKNGNPIPIKKVRIFTRLQEPLMLKRHRDISVKKAKLYKKNYYVANDENYIMALYEGKNAKNKIKRDSEIFNNLKTINFYKASNRNSNTEIVPKEKMGLPLKQILQSGMFVLLWRESPNEIWALSELERANRLYIIRGLDDDGIKLYFHQEARPTVDVIKHMNNVINEFNVQNNILDKKGEIKKSKLTSPKGGDVLERSDEFPYIKFQPSNFNALIEGIDFKLTVLGEIENLQT